MSWFNGLEAICRTDVPLAEHTWYGLGGTVRWLCTPRGEKELALLLQRCQAAEIPWRILGRGANVLVRDEGFDGAVIKLSEPVWDQVRFDGPLVHAGAGADLPRLVREALDHELVGLENLTGIPGTLGGAIRMNAGGRHGCISEYIRAVRLMTADGHAATHPVAELAFGYRTSNIGRRVIIAATLELQPGERDIAMTRYRQIWNEKYSSQPPVSARSAGCVFKNPPGQAAGQLIDQAGLKGTRRGGAEISPRHANFILAHPGARATDVLDLISLAQQRVHSATGIALELEIEVW
jgi:UDP-N-acetylmuramate dehydrogenase